AGESGAVGLGLLSIVMDHPQYAELREVMGLGRDARVLLFNTEGATDPVMYRRIVWDGYLSGS
ncbi:MAG: diaminopropionate ammonia-lyase, partial [Firmicutes bacterium]|nr:diaminopropionate ammonia-lyase [Bacillota bacterium]